jgi:lipopolysaccharide transport system ATP-binding protein
MAPAIRLQNVSKCFRRHPHARLTTLKTYLLRECWQRRQRPCDVTWAVQDISLDIERGATVGIVGRNGSGKSTLLHLMRGVFRPTSGSVWIGGKLSALIELGAGFHPELTGRENILINGIILGLSKVEIRRRFDRIVKFAELEDFIDQPVRTYSTGMYMRLGFSIAAHVNPEILLIDEVLAVGDLPFVHKCHEHLLHFKREGKTIVMVTHDLEMVDRWCDEAVWIDDGRLRLRGEPARVTALYREAVG